MENKNESSTEQIDCGITPHSTILVVEDSLVEAELLRRTVYWLMKEPELEEEQLTAEIRGDRLMVQRRSLEKGVLGARLAGLRRWSRGGGWFRRS